MMGSVSFITVMLLGQSIDRRDFHALNATNTSVWRGTNDEQHRGHIMASHIENMRPSHHNAVIQYARHVHLDVLRIKRRVRGKATA